MPSTNPISNEHLAELLQVILDPIADNNHPSHAHLQLAGRLQAHLTEMRGKEPLPAELTGLRDDIATLRAAREQERDRNDISGHSGGRRRRSDAGAAAAIFIAMII